MEKLTTRAGSHDANDSKNNVVRVGGQARHFRHPDDACLSEALDFSRERAGQHFINAFAIQVHDLKMPASAIDFFARAEQAT